MFPKKVIFIRPKTSDYLEELVSRYPKLETVKNDINSAFDCIYECYKNGGKVFICGNGGSAADCEHIAGELLKGFLLKRPLSDEKKAEFGKKFGDAGNTIADMMQGSLPAVSLVSMSAILTAVSNDVSGSMIYAQQVYGLCIKGDIIIALSTSGNAENVINAVITASMQGGKSIAITGNKESRLAEVSDICIKVPESETFKVQELTLPIYHTLCMMVENEFFEE